MMSVRSTPSYGAVRKAYTLPVQSLKLKMDAWAAKLRVSPVCYHAWIATSAVSHTADVQSAYEPACSGMA